MSFPSNEPSDTMHKIKDGAMTFNASAWGAMPYWSDPYFTDGYTPPPEMTAKRINDVVSDTVTMPISDPTDDNESGFNPSKHAIQLDKKLSKQLGIYNITSLGADPTAYIDDLEEADLVKYMGTSKFFSQTGITTDRADRKAFQDNQFDNPEGIAVKWARKEADDAVRDPNSIQEPNLDDPGHADFEYNIRDGDQLNMVKESVESFLERRDRFLIPPPQGTFNLTPSLLQQLQFQQAMEETGG